MDATARNFEFLENLGSRLQIEARMWEEGLGAVTSVTTRSMTLSMPIEDGSIV